MIVCYFVNLRRMRYMFTILTMHKRVFESFTVQHLCSFEQSIDSSCNLSIPLKTWTISFSLLTSTLFFKCDIFFDALMLESDIHSCHLRLWEAISFDNFSCHHRSFCHCCYSLFFSTQYPAKSCGRTKKAPLQMSESVLNKFLPCMYASEMVHKINDMDSKSLWSINKSTNLWMSFLHHVHGKLWYCNSASILFKKR